MSRSKHRSRERLPVVLSITALAVAVLGVTPLGEAAREALVPRNSVGTAQLRNNAVVSAKVRDGSLLASDFKAGVIPAPAPERIVSARVSTISNEGKVLLKDEATGLEVRVGRYGSPRLVNTNERDSLRIQGVGYGPSQLYSVERGIAPGSSIDVIFDAAYFKYGQFLVKRDVESGSSLALNCGFVDGSVPSAVQLYCIAVR